VEPRVLLHDGAGSGDPVVLLPGGLTGWVSWIPHQERLAENWRVFRVQPIANELGSAGVVGDPSYSGFVERESLRMTLDHLGLDRVHLGGWSAGGHTAIEFTLRHPDRVRSLTLVEPGSHWMLPHLGFADERLEELDALMADMAGREVTDDDLAEFLVRVGLVIDAGDARSHPYWERSQPHRQTLSWMSPDLFVSDATLDDLRSITCPALVVKGTVTEPWEKRVVDALGEMLPAALVLELEGGHASHIESIDRFLEEMEQHLRSA
jgi:pimeloyl-ACP methyl ester carboxylesterase